MTLTEAIQALGREYLGSLDQLVPQTLEMTAEQIMSVLAREMTEYSEINESKSIQYLKALYYKIESLHLDASSEVLLKGINSLLATYGAPALKKDILDLGQSYMSSFPEASLTHANQGQAQGMIDFANKKIISSSPEGEEEKGDLDIRDKEMYAKDFLKEGLALLKLTYNSIIERTSKPGYLAREINLILRKNFAITLKDDMLALGFRYLEAFPEASLAHTNQEHAQEIVTHAESIKNGFLPIETECDILAYLKVIFETLIENKSRMGELARGIDKIFKITFEGPRQNNNPYSGQKIIRMSHGATISPPSSFPAMMQNCIDFKKDPNIIARNSADGNTQFGEITDGEFRETSARQPERVTL